MMWLIKDLMCESDVSEVLWGELLHFCQLEACLFSSLSTEETVLFYAFLISLRYKERNARIFEQVPSNSNFSGSCCHHFVSFVCGLKAYRRLCTGINRIGKGYRALDQQHKNLQEQNGSMSGLKMSPICLECQKYCSLTK